MKKSTVTIAFFLMLVSLAFADDATFVDTLTTKVETAVYAFKVMFLAGLLLIFGIILYGCGYRIAAGVIKWGASEGKEEIDPEPPYQYTMRTTSSNVLN